MQANEISITAFLSSLVAKFNATATKGLLDAALASERSLVDLHAVEKLHMMKFENDSLHIKSKHSKLHSIALGELRDSVARAKSAAIGLSQVCCCFNSFHFPLQLIEFLSQCPTENRPKHFIKHKRNC